MKSAKNELNSLDAVGGLQNLDPPYSCMLGCVYAYVHSSGEKGHTFDRILRRTCKQNFLKSCRPRGSFVVE